MSEQTPAELRDAFEAAQKELKKLNKTVEELSGENRKLKAGAAFRDADLSPDLADLFVAANPELDDITVDAATEFATKYGISGPVDTGEGDDVTDGDEGATTSDADKGLDKIARAGSGAGGTGQPPASQKILSRQEFLDMQRTDPTSAQKALAEGRVKLRGDNPLVTGSAPTVGVNPFAAEHQGSEE